MIWQDWAIMVACFGFGLALIPSIRGKNKPARASCIFTIVLLAIIGVSFATLKLWASFASEVVTAIAWGILFFQKRHHDSAVNYGYIDVNRFTEFPEYEIGTRLVQSDFSTYRYLKTDSGYGWVDEKLWSRDAHQTRTEVNDNAPEKDG